MKSSFSFSNLTASLLSLVLCLSSLQSQLILSAQAISDGTLVANEATSTLTDMEAEYLKTRKGLIFVDDITSLDQLQERFVNILKLHVKNFNERDQAEVDRYLIEKFDIKGEVPPTILTRKQRALEEFIATIGDFLNKEFSQSELEYLRERRGIQRLSTIRKTQDLEDTFFNALETNIFAIDRYSEDNIETFLQQYFDLSGDIPLIVQNKRKEAIKRFVESLPEQSFAISRDEQHYVSNVKGVVLAGVDNLDKLEDHYLTHLKNHTQDFDNYNKDAIKKYLNEIYKYDEEEPIPESIVERQDKAIHWFVKSLAPREEDLNRFVGDELEFLTGLEGSISLAKVNDLGQLEKRLAETLRMHQRDFVRGQEIAYLEKLFGLPAILPKPIEERRKRAIAGYRKKTREKGAVDCGECDELKDMFRDLSDELQTEKSNAVSGANQVKTYKLNHNDRIDQIIAEAQCSPTENLSRGPESVSGRVYGRVFLCNNRADVLAMNSSLYDFWQSFVGSAEELTIRDAEEKLAVAHKKLRVMADELTRIKKQMDNCLRTVKRKKECRQAMARTQEEPLRTDGAFTATKATQEEFLVPFREVNSSKLIALAEKFRDVTTKQVNIDSFSDVRGKPGHVKEAIRRLTNRVPIFKGNEGGATFGADEQVQRAVLAETLKRLGRMGDLAGYIDEVIDYSTRLEDVPSGKWYENAMRSAVARGIFKPQNNRVRPGDTLNWAELVTVIRRWAELDPIVPSSSPVAGVITGKWYTPEFFALKQAGLLDDFEVIDPSARPSKADLALIVNRMLEQSGIFLSQ